jgi:hypothetical protein
MDVNRTISGFFNGSIDSSHDFNGTNVTFLGDSIAINSQIQVTFSTIAQTFFEQTRAILAQDPVYSNNTNVTLDDQSPDYNATEAAFFINQLFN